MTLKPPGDPNTPLGDGRIYHNVVSDFGASGNGTRDDTAAVQNAINAAGLSRGVVYFPSGVYIISQPLVLKYRVNLIGGGQTFHEAKDTSSTARATIKLADSSECHMLTMDPFAPVRGGQSIDHTYQHSYIQGLNFYGNKSNQTTTSKAILYCYRMWGLTVRNCNFDHAAGDAIWLDDVNAVNLFDCGGTEGDRFGVYIKDSADVQAIGLQFFGHAGPQLLLDNSWKCNIVGQFGNTVTAIDALASGLTAGIVLQNTSTSNYIAGRSDQNLGDGVYIDATSRSNIVDVYTLENGYNNGTAKAGFRIAGDDNVVRGTVDYMPSASENQETGVVLEATASNNWVDVVVDTQHTTEYDYSALSASVGRSQIPREQFDYITSQTTASWVPASGFGAIQGSPSLSTIGGSRRVAWLLDAAADESVSASIFIPSGWTKVKFTVHHTNGGAGSGDVMWSVQGKSFAVAADLNVADDAHDTTQTAPAQDILASFSTSATTMNATENTLYTLRIKRIGSGGADTLANDAALIGVLVEKAT